MKKVGVHHDSSPPPTPEEWGPPPTAAEVAEAVLAVLEAHGWCDASASEPVPALETLESPKDWAKIVLKSALCPFGELPAGLLTRFAAGVVYYDREMIYREDDYARLTDEFTEATSGQWRLANLSSSYVPVDGVPLCDTTAVNFDHDGRHFRWQFSGTCSDWVQAQFEGYVSEFAEQHLPGRFINLPTFDQTAEWLYLPAQVVEDLRSAVCWPSADALVGSVRAAASGELDWPRRVPAEACGWLGTWPRIDAQATDGTLALHEAVRLRQVHTARNLIESWGADPTARDGSGRTAYDWASDAAFCGILNVDEEVRIWRRAILLYHRI